MMDPAGRPPVPGAVGITTLAQESAPSGQTHAPRWHAHIGGGGRGRTTVQEIGHRARCCTRSAVAAPRATPICTSTQILPHADIPTRRGLAKGKCVGRSDSFLAKSQSEQRPQSWSLDPCRGLGGLLAFRPRRLERMAIGLRTLTRSVSEGNRASPSLTLRVSVRNPIAIRSKTSQHATNTLTPVGVVSPVSILPIVPASRPLSFYPVTSRLPILLMLWKAPAENHCKGMESRVGTSTLPPVSLRLAERSPHGRAHPFHRRTRSCPRFSARSP